ncbi:MAG: DUF6036 family nucleotidyltransferase [Candidatus Woesearchaeota archaeon]
MNDFIGITELLTEINSVLNHRVSVYAIGGTALLYRGLKSSTKDIDIIVGTRREYNELVMILRQIGFIPRIPDKYYSNMNLSQILVRDDYRIDLFEKSVCSKFMLSESMIARSDRIFGMDKLSFSLCSNEDVFMFKTMTDREGDLDDCMTIAYSSIDWSIIMDEIVNQIRISGNDIWITWIGERLDILVDRGIVIPIMSRINGLRRKYYHGTKA